MLNFLRVLRQLPALFPGRHKCAILLIADTIAMVLTLNRRDKTKTVLIIYSLDSYIVKKRSLKMCGNLAVRFVHWFYNIPKMLYNYQHHIHYLITLLLKLLIVDIIYFSITQFKLFQRLPIYFFCKESYGRQSAVSGEHCEARRQGRRLRG